jgi:hypothetical protein
VAVDASNFTVKLGTVNNKAPRDLPLKGIHAYDKVQGLDVDALVTQLEQAGALTGCAKTSDLVRTPYFGLWLA